MSQGSKCKWQSTEPEINNPRRTSTHTLKPTALRPGGDHAVLHTSLLLSSVLLQDHQLSFSLSFLMKNWDELPSWHSWRWMLVVNVNIPPSAERLSQRNPRALKILIPHITTHILSSFLFIWTPSTSNKEMASVVFSFTILAKIREISQFLSPVLADGFSLSFLKITEYKKI